MTNRTRWLFGALVMLAAFAFVMPDFADAQTATVVPRVKFSRAFDQTKPVYIEVAIVNGPSVVITLAPGIRKGNFILEGVLPNRNYIIVARASNDPKFAPENTQVLKAFVGKAQMADITAVVNINPATTPLAEAVSLYCENTGYDLNDPAIEADLDSIVAAADPGAVAEGLSTTSVSGTVVNINNVPVSGATVSTVGVLHSATSATDASGNFSLVKVPLRCRRLEATCAPRYLAAQSDEIALQQNTSLAGVLIQLMPNPADARSDIREAVRLMVDNSSGNLADYLAEDPNSFTYSLTGSTGTTSLDRAGFMATVPGTYREISWLDSDYTQTLTADSKSVTFTISAWTTRDSGTYRRTAYKAQGEAVFEGALWRLKSLNLTDEKKLPVAPVPQVTSGDGSATIRWTASSDSLVTGYNLYRTATDTAPVDGAVPIKTLGKSEITYIDADLSTGTYYYWICAVESYDPGTGVQSVFGPLSAGVKAVVFSSRTVVEQFMQCAVNRDQAGMNALLSDSFQAVFPGTTYGMTKANFVNWAMDVFSLDGVLPNKLWRVDSAYKDGNWLKVRAFQIGHRLNTTPARNSRLIEDESWEVLNVTGTAPVITRFALATPKYYPIAPANVRCTNQGTAESDGHVDLAWDKPDDPELKGYRILRSETQDYSATTARWLQAEGTYLAPDQTTHTDPISVAGKTYFYWVVAYDNYDINTMTEENKNNCVQIGLPAEVKLAAQSFLESTVNHNVTGVRSAVTANFQASQVSRVFTLDAYCAALSSVPPTLNLASYQFLWAVRDVIDGVETLRVTYTCTGTWDQLTISRAEIEVIKVDNVWKVKTATFVDVTG